jgi:hypothetical protein
MVTNEEFAFSIGYDGPAAVVDKAACAQYGHLDPEALAEKGLFRAAYAKALRSGDEGSVKSVMDAYNKLAGTSFNTKEQFSRLLGVYLDNALRVKKL